jgi:hypothetical protein
MYATNYAKFQNTPSFIGSEGENWTLAADSDVFQIAGFIDFVRGYEWKVRNRYFGVGELLHGTGVFSPVYSNVGSSDFSPGPAPGWPNGWPFLDGPFGGAPNWPYPTTGVSGALLGTGAGYIKSPQLSGSVTFSNGVTMSWSQGTGW